MMVLPPTAWQRGHYISFVCTVDLELRQIVVDFFNRLAQYWDTAHLPHKYKGFGTISCINTHLNIKVSKLP